MARSIDYDSVADVYDDFVDATYDHAFFQDEVRRVTGNRVLELGAGTGRLSLPLLEAGADLTCLDVAPAMLEQLEKKAVAQGFEVTTRRADICELNESERYRLVLFPFQSFMELVGLERQQTALDRIHEALLPGGRFLCTLHNPTIRRRLVDGRTRKLGDFPSAEGILTVTGTETGGNPVMNRIQRLSMVDHRGATVWERRMEMAFELIEPDQFASMARNAGFRIEKRYGGYAREPFDPSSSPVVIFDLERPPSAAA